MVIRVLSDGVPKKNMRIREIPRCKIESLGTAKDVVVGLLRKIINVYWSYMRIRSSQEHETGDTDVTTYEPPNLGAYDKQPAHLDDPDIDQSEGPSIASLVEDVREHDSDGLLLVFRKFNLPYRAGHLQGIRRDLEDDKTYQEWTQLTRRESA